jgi:Na+-transporting NADH:ubiquinone oxidoreductase subunit NqrB
MRTRPPWSDRRRRTLIGLGAATAVLAAASFLPDEIGVTALFLTALCAFLLVVAAIVFVVVPGPDTLGTLLRSTTLAGPALVVAVLLLLAAPAELRPLWWAATAGAAAWTATALWRNRGAEPPEG